MPLALLRCAFRRRPLRRLMPPTPTRKKHYDVVIIGGGGHGLACAYYLAKNHGIRNVAVLDKSWLAGGNTARNTTIIRSNYLTAEAVRFYGESMRLYQNLSSELDINLLYSPRGHLTLAHTDAACRTARWRANMNRHLGEDSRFVDRRELAELCPQLNMSETVRYPIQGALYHPPGAIARHDAVAWGYAIRAAEMGVSVFSHTEVTEVLQAGGKAVGVRLADGSEIGAGTVMQAVAGQSSQVAAMAGFKVPITSIPLQAMVSQPLAPFLDPIIVSGSLHVYISQSARGELVMGGSVDPRPLHRSRSTLHFKESLAGDILQLFPFLGGVRLLRQWAGVADMTADFSPVMGKTPLDNYYIDAGWGTWGFKATPVCGVTMAETVATGQPPALITPYAMSRFDNLSLVGEKGAAAVGH
ncbi:FAD-dependent oxidoreductase [Candidatus Persebacteraceae bacterium Df01]|uniref:FAD-dependent oxidoreductase n=1 Tax=Candidatus Doriopsillibacter californiensis TaxID=2970740 RepID=A0ABT7QLL6_9GAMM|nr:FAD-dependent oxidoreductase [Candidatus Persebacteraceae bacterium Df01]